jgi:adenine-specific DNA-methyltransferase
MDTAAVKEKIEALVTKYNAEAASGKLKRYSEEDVKNVFIKPLFEALGWNIADRDEASAEEHIKSAGRVDYGFSLNGQTVFYLEAKSFDVNIHDEKWARQAIRYSWNKGVTWAALTNFEHLIIFNAQDIESSLHNKKLFDISCADYLSNFDKLQLLSKESLKTGKLDKYAEGIGKKYQKIPIGLLLYKDLNECRSLLTKSLSAWNKEKFKDDPAILDEGVQKLLDRLIFIRVAEDRGVEPQTLIPLVREWKTSKQKNEIPLYQSMVKKFRELDKIYDANFFSEHPFETWDEYDDVTEKVINILHGKEGYYEYDFKIMPADVLGTVYENYLGYQLQQAQFDKKKLFKGTEVKLSKDSQKRKEQGIYYTPAFVVDYIVRHALQPVLDKCKTYQDVIKIKVLDPACGSGSFLLKALEVFNEKYKELGQKGDEETKRIILTCNLYGVDLDKKAVEIAGLNLLINSLDRRETLPAPNIKCGNSLLSGTDTELKNYFGPNFQEKKPFNWEEEFPDVFAQDGFDVVIGNPPWVSNDNVIPEEKAYFKNLYKVGASRFDIATLFAERGLTILKKGGFLGFVMPEHIWIGDYFRPFREYLETHITLEEILSSKEENFGQVSNPSSLFLVKKAPPKAGVQRFVVGSFNAEKLEKNEVQMSIAERVIFNQFAYELKNKMEKEKNQILGDMALVTDGIQTANLLKEIFTQEPKNENDYVKALRSGAAIRFRYSPINWDGWWVLRPELTRKLKRPGFSYDSPKRMKCFGAAKKIILRQTEPTIIATLDEDKYFFPNSIFQIAIEGGDLKKLRFLLGILNSKFLRFYYSKLSQVEGTTKPQLYLNILKSLPIPRFDSVIEELVSKMLELNKKLLVVEEHSDEWERIKSEIQKIDKKIDVTVYKLYNLTGEEINIIEQSQ